MNTPKTGNELTNCPHLGPPRCSGHLYVTQRESDGHDYGEAAHAACTVCRRVWTGAQLRVEGIKIEEVRP